jgi:predicted transposase/invertase (TIGR01784 family)
MNTLTYVSQDPKVRRIYNERLKAQNDAINEISHAKNAGIAIGEKRGEKRGIALGEKKGRAEGRAEGKRETALSMLANGLSIELINKCTGLSEDEIRKKR